MLPDGDIERRADPRTELGRKIGRWVDNGHPDSKEPPSRQAHDSPIHARQIVKIQPEDQCPVGVAHWDGVAMTG